MRAIVVYESMFGNTHEVAGRIGDGLAGRYQVSVVPVSEATPELVRGADLVVVGAPTHVHGLSSGKTRHAAADQAAQHDDLELDEHADDPGIRDWLAGLDRAHAVPAASFDTRTDGPALLTGRACRAIGRQLARHGFALIADPESFLVDHHNHLVSGEADRAQAWGATLATPAVT